MCFPKRLQPGTSVAMRIRVLGAHNLESNATRHTCFLVDGLLAIDAGSIASAISRQEQKRVRAVLLTHHHIDHARDLPTLGLAMLDGGEPIDVYGLEETLRGARTHLFDGSVYPDLSQPLNGEAPRLRLNSVRVGHPLTVLGYQVTPMPAKHPVPAVGYIVRSGGRAIAYTGDTSDGLLEYLRQDPPLDTLFVDVTFPNELEARAELTGHLTPRTLGRQLRAALKERRKLPSIVPVHLSTLHHPTIEKELALLGKELDIHLAPAHEDMVLP